MGKKSRETHDAIDNFVRRELELHSIENSLVPREPLVVEQHREEDPDAFIHG